MNRKSSAYTNAGVDIDAKMDALKKSAQRISLTNAHVRGGVPPVSDDIGNFGGMFPAPGKGKILVASTDGVGTKLKVAAMAGKHDTVGEDIVNHCVNDILVHGAEPLFFLDYFGTSNFKSEVFKAAIKGVCKACRENGCVLIAGETAELPGVYEKGEYDLVGTIVGVVDRRNIITGKNIRPNDVVIGLSSSGLHTNGYSLARKIIFEDSKFSVTDRLPGYRKSFGAALLAVHRSYLKPVRELLRKMPVCGMAHITGGGFQDNIPRVLPANVDAIIDRASWTVPPIFRFLHERGHVEREEMYRVFNMGIGYVIVMRRACMVNALRILRSAGAKAEIIGRIEKGSGIVRFVN